MPEASDDPAHPVQLFRTDGSKSVALMEPNTCCLKI